MSSKMDDNLPRVIKNSHSDIHVIESLLDSMNNINSLTEPFESEMNQCENNRIQCPSDNFYHIHSNKKSEEYTNIVTNEDSFTGSDNIVMYSRYPHNIIASIGHPCCNNSFIRVTERHIKYEDQDLYELHFILRPMELSYIQESNPIYKIHELLSVIPRLLLKKFTINHTGKSVQNLGYIVDCMRDDELVYPEAIINNTIDGEQIHHI